MSDLRLQAIERGLDALDRLPQTAPTMDGRYPLHQDCRELLAEVKRLRALLKAQTPEGPVVA